MECITTPENSHEVSSSSAFLVLCALVGLIYSLKEYIVRNRTNNLPAPFPQLPFIGHLHLLQGNASQKFSELSRKYGGIFYLRMGVFDTVIINSLPLIREVLTDKRIEFTGRPNFLRFKLLFGNDKENSLAFCDWSQCQKTRRALARKYCHTGYYADRIERGVERTGEILLPRLKNDLEINGDNACETLKSHIQKACAAVFIDYFCSIFTDDWDNDTEFNLVVQLFDEIFYEINQGHVTDVLPRLSGLFSSHLTNLAQKGVDIRKYVMERIIEPHRIFFDKENLEDLTDVLLNSLDAVNPDDRLSMDQVLYELEDFIGGHSAVSNLLCRALVDIGSTPGMSMKIYQKYFVEHKHNYLHAVIYEALRKTSSPIVPHVATSEASIGDYPIKKGTIVFISNYDLNTSDLYWKNPLEFNPDRFISPDGSFQKPAHFFPFSYGKRTCMGYQLVERVGEGILGLLIKNYDIEALESPTVLPIASIALHPQQQVRVRLIPRFD